MTDIPMLEQYYKAMALIQQALDILYGIRQELEDYKEDQRQ